MLSAGLKKTIALETETLEVHQEFLSPDEYIEFLSRTDLGSQYPKEDFRERIAILVKSVPVSLVVRNAGRTIVAVCFAITDFAYWQFVTDLGVARDYVRRGLGRELLRLAHELCGGEKRIIQYLCANEDAIDFYLKAGMERADDIMRLSKVDWTEFTVGQNDL